MMKIRLVLILFLFTALASLNAQGRNERDSNSLYQVSIIDALLAGQYDGTYTLSNLLKHGNFGIGTFDRLDGEMIVLDGKIYQFKTDGNIYQANLATKTPFASVINFKSSHSFVINNEMNMKTFQAVLDSAINNKNLLYAVKVTGKFKYVKTRSVPAQEKPYLPLSEVTKHQAVFEKNAQEGTIVGFRLPSFINGINVPGYHLHFINNDKSFGGHILDFILESAKVDIDELNKFEMILPEGDNSFKSIDLSKDRSKELEKVEK